MPRLLTRPRSAFLDIAADSEFNLLDDFQVAASVHREIGGCTVGARLLAPRP
jgi:hypothetical protein